MPNMLVLIITLLLVAGGLFYYEMNHSSAELNDMPESAVAFGMIVRMLVAVVIIALGAIVLSNLSLVV